MVVFQIEVSAWGLGKWTFLWFHVKVSCPVSKSEGFKLRLPIKVLNEEFELNSKFKIKIENFFHGFS